MVIENLGRTTRRTVAIASAAIVAGSAAAVTMAAPPIDEEAVAFLGTELIDDVATVAEGNSVDCAALMAFMSTGFAAGIAQADEDGEFGEHADELVFAISSPLLLPLLLQATPPTDAGQAVGVDLITTELAGTIAELQELGFSEDQLLDMQRSLAYSYFDVGDPDEVDTIDAAMESLVVEFVGHDFESITFLDGDGVIDDAAEDSLPWQESCPDTVALFEFDMDPVSVTLDVEVVMTAPSAETTETTEPQS